MAKFQGRQNEMRALNTYIKLMRAAESLTARAHEHLSSAGLTISQFGVLEALHHVGPMSQKDIGQKILRSSGNITMVIDNLEKRRLVRRERDERDRRSFIVHLTDAGNKLIRKIFPPHAAVITTEMNALTAAEQKTLGDLCKKLGLRDKV
ncbi:MAG: MarR family transcriptional regulator [Deltaproteobacteria bacterium]|jgi:MarR family 2-MHQ and catechol resistance regulon transcriptional repressor|nr:MarR family transcriptional regulator [Deltaproteobacteria bacterium]